MKQANHDAIYQTLMEIPGGWKYRWAFEYSTGVRRYGGWNADYEDVHLKASTQNLNGLRRAFIEAMDNHRVVHVAVECPGTDFCMFQWVHEGMLSKFGALQSRIIGLTLVTRSEKVTMLGDGTAEVSARPLGEQDNQFRYGV